MNYNFIEIGTSNFDTLAQRATDEHVGLSVEPVKEYLEELPKKKHITKVNEIETGVRFIQFGMTIRQNEDVFPQQITMVDGSFFSLFELPLKIKVRYFIITINNYFL